MFKNGKRDDICKKEEERGEIKENMESKNVICFWEKGEYFQNSPRKGNIIFSPHIPTSLFRITVEAA